MCSIAIQAVPVSQHGAETLIDWHNLPNDSHDISSNATSSRPQQATPSQVSMAMVEAGLFPSASSLPYTQTSSSPVLIKNKSENILGVGCSLMIDREISPPTHSDTPAIRISYSLSTFHTPHTHIERNNIATHIQKSRVPALKPHMQRIDLCRGDIRKIDAS